MGEWEFNLTQKQPVLLIEPFGYMKISETNAAVEIKDEAVKEKLEAKAWSVATGGFSQIFMTIFMMWMVGNQINIFSIMITFQFISSPINTFFNVNKAFHQFEGKIDLRMCKLAYLGISGFSLIIGFYKLYTLGLLPLNPSDWIDLIPLHHQSEVFFALD